MASFDESFDMAFGDLVGLSGADEKRVPFAANPSDGGVAHRGQPNLGMRLLIRSGGGPSVGHIEETPVMCHLVLGPQANHKLQSFGVAGRPVFKTGPESLELLRSVSQPQAEDESSLGDVVDGCDLLGDVHGIQKWKQQDGCRQFHVPWLRGQPRQHRQRLEVLEWINQIMMRPTVDIKSGIPRGTELLQLVLPLLLQAN